MLFDDSALVAHSAADMQVLVLQSLAFHVPTSDRSCWDRSMERRQRSISVVLSWSVC